MGEIKSRRQLFSLSSQVILHVCPKMQISFLLKGYLVTGKYNYHVITEQRHLLVHNAQWANKKHKVHGKYINYFKLFCFVLFYLLASIFLSEPYGRPI